MDVAFVTGLGLQVAALLVLFGSYGARCFRRPGFYFVAIAFAYHGIAEIGIRVTGRKPPLRPDAFDEVVGDWMVLVGASLLVFSLIYVALTERDAVASQTPESRRGEVLAALPWQMLALPTGFLLSVVATGGYRGGAAASYGEGIAGTEAGLTQQFLTPLLILTMIGYIASGSSRRLLPTLAAGTLAIALTGSRLGAVVLIGLTLFGLTLLGRRPTRRQVAVSVCLIAAFVVVVDQSRQHVGRYALTQAASATERFALLAQGVSAAVQGDTASFADQATQPWTERLDGNTFPAMVLGELQAGESPVGVTTVVNDLALAVPSAVNPAKRSNDLVDRSEKLYLRQWFVLDLPLDFIPTQFGVLVAYLGPWGLPFLAGGLATVYAWGDRLMHRRPVYGFLVSLALLGCATSYEAGMEVYVLTARGFAVLVGGAAVLHLLRRRTINATVRSR